MKPIEKFLAVLGGYIGIALFLVAPALSYSNYSGTEQVGIVLLWPLFAVKYAALGIIAGFEVLI